YRSRTRQSVPECSDVLSRSRQRHHGRKQDAAQPPQPFYRYRTYHSKLLSSPAGTVSGTPPKYRMKSDKGTISARNRFFRHPALTVTPPETYSSGAFPPMSPNRDNAFRGLSSEHCRGTYSSVRACLGRRRSPSTMALPIRPPSRPVSSNATSRTVMSLPEVFSTSSTAFTRGDACSDTSTSEIPWNTMESFLIHP